jgi:hypothetical protein
MCPVAPITTTRRMPTAYECRPRRAGLGGMCDRHLAPIDCHRSASGVSGAVDRNYFNGDRSRLIALANNT